MRWTGAGDILSQCCSLGMEQGRWPEAERVGGEGHGGAGVPEVNESMEIHPETGRAPLCSPGGAEAW